MLFDGWIAQLLSADWLFLLPHGNLQHLDLKFLEILLLIAFKSTGMHMLHVHT